MANQAQEAQAIYDMALYVPPGHLRATFVAEACAGNIMLREQVEAMLIMNQQNVGSANGAARANTASDNSYSKASAIVVLVFLGLGCVFVVALFGVFAFATLIQNESRVRLPVDIEEQVRDEVTDYVDALAHFMTGEYEQAIPYFKKAHEQNIILYGPGHKKTLECRGILAECYLETGEPDLAHQLFLDQVKLLRAQDPPRRIEILKSLVSWGDAEIQLGNYVAAEEHLREALKSFDPENGAPPEMSNATGWLGVERSKAAAWLGVALSKQQRHSEAEPLLLQGYSGLREVEQRDEPRYARKARRVAEQLVAQYEAQEQSDQAEQWRAVVSGTKGND